MMMKEICLPINNIPDNAAAEMEIRIPNSPISWHFKLECLEIRVSDITGGLVERAKKVQHYIDNYSKDWELLQILDTPEQTGYVHFLYRQLNKST